MPQEKPSGALHLARSVPAEFIVGKQRGGAGVALMHHFHLSDRPPLDEHERARIEALRRLVAAREKALLRERHACKDLSLQHPRRTRPMTSAPCPPSTYRPLLAVRFSKCYREGRCTDGRAAGGELAAQVATSGPSNTAGRTWTAASGRAPRTHARYACTSRERRAMGMLRVGHR